MTGSTLALDNSTQSERQSLLMSPPLSWPPSSPAQARPLPDPAPAAPVAERTPPRGRGRVLVPDLRLHAEGRVRGCAGDEIRRAGDEPRDLELLRLSDGDGVPRCVWVHHVQRSARCRHEPPP